MTCIFHGYDNALVVLLVQRRIYNHEDRVGWVRRASHGSLWLSTGFEHAVTQHSIRPYLCIIVLILIAAFCPGQLFAQQPADPSSPGELELDDRFNLDESTFDGELSEHESFNPETPHFMDNLIHHFTFRLSQQVYAQINNQGSETDSGRRSSKTGIENNRLNLWAKYQNPFAPGWLLQGTSQTKLFWPGDYEYGAHNDPGLAEFRVSNFIEFRINEIFIQRSFSHNSFKLGRQIIVWGEVEGNSVVDVLNTREFRDLSVIEIEDARLNQWLLRWDYYQPHYRLSTFFNFYPEFNPQPRQGSPLFVELDFSLNEPERDQFLYEVGSQLRWSFGASDIALMAAYLYENPLRFQPPSSGEAMAIENDHWMIGASANRAIGKVLLKLDLAYNHGVLADTRAASQIPSTVIKNQVGASLGVEYAISNEQHLNASVAAQYFLDQSEGLATGERLLNRNVFDRWRIRYSHYFLNRDLLVSSTVIGSFDDENLAMRLSLDYTVDDHWSVIGQVISTWASADSSTAVLDQDVRLGLTVTYSF